MKNENNSELLYESPEVKIYEMRVQSVICGSPAGGIDQMSWDGNITDGDSWN